jgi:site-specific DNA-methyltransferase (adenine-specific)
MKANNGSGNTIERDNWETPDWLFELLNKQYNLKFDCCATKKNRKCENHSNNFKEIKGTTLNAWMNPPFSKAYEMFHHFFKVIQWGVAIYRCDNMETKIWQDIILPSADWIFLPKARINYVGHDGHGARFPSALIGIGVEPPKEIEGSVLIIKKEKP